MDTLFDKTNVVPVLFSTNSVKTRKGSKSNRKDGQTDGIAVSLRFPIAFLGKNGEKSR